MTRLARSPGHLDGVPGWLVSFLLALVMALWVSPVDAQTSEVIRTELSANQPSQSLGQHSGLTSLTPDEVTTEASRWGLTDDEYLRYLDAMRGIRGHLSGPGITPIEVLGTEATTAAERRKYAEMWVEAINADTAKVLAFSNEVFEAWQRLYPNASMIDEGRINELRARAGALEAPIFVGAQLDQVRDRLMLFTRAGCEACDNDVKTLVGRTAEGDFTGLDIYVVDVHAGQNEVIQAWARRVGLPRDLVTAGRVTLNYDNGTFATVTEGLKSTPANWPVAVHRNGGTFEQVALDH